MATVYQMKQSDSSFDEIKSQLESNKECCVQSYTPERISTLKKRIKQAYKPGLGIMGTTLCKILFGYQQALYKYEGSAYYFFNLVATRSNGVGSKKGKLFFVWASEAERSAYPVLESNYHNYGKSSKTQEIAELLSELSGVVAKLSKVVSEIK